MQADRYNVKIGSEENTFYFFSSGPKGSIKKRVEFYEFESRPGVYNLAFGDVNEFSEIDDIIVTNNDDSKQVLATVASCVQLFLLLNPKAFVFAQGSTPARTRLYRMGITINLKAISEEYKVLGYTNGWEIFNIGTEYEAFLILKQNL